MYDHTLIESTTSVSNFSTLAHEKIYMKQDSNTVSGFIILDSALTMVALVIAQGKDGI